MINSSSVLIAVELFLRDHHEDTMILLVHRGDIFHVFNGLVSLPAVLRSFSMSLAYAYVPKGAKRIVKPIDRNHDR